MTSNQWVNPRAQNQLDSSKTQGVLQVGKPLRMTVPQQGILYSFEKLYANQSDVNAGFEIRYASSSGNNVSLLISIISVLMIWLVIFAIKSSQFSARSLVVVFLIGVAGLILSLIYFKSNPVGPLSTALAGGVVYLVVMLLPKLKRKV